MPRISDPIYPNETDESYEQYKRTWKYKVVAKWHHMYAVRENLPGWVRFCLLGMLYRGDYIIEWFEVLCSK